MLGALNPSRGQLNRPGRLHLAARAMQRRSSQKGVEYVKEFSNALMDNLNVPKSDFKGDALLDELKDTDKLGKRGEAYVIGQAILIFAVIFPIVDLSVMVRLLGFGLLGLGGAIIVAGSINLASSLTPLPVPRKDAKLVTDGMYRYMRHPLYTGLFLGSSGVAAMTQDSTRMLFAVGLIVLLSFKADFEERELRKVFGAEYETYMEKVNKFWFV
jgi:protein-S-isoprenylcysteine O-methyltransferase Ste14